MDSKSNNDRTTKLEGHREDDLRAAQDHREDDRKEAQELRHRQGNDIAILLAAVSLRLSALEKTSNGSSATAQLGWMKFALGIGGAVILFLLALVFKK